MAGGFCEHGKIWTTCPECGKEVIQRAKSTRRRRPEDEMDQRVQRVQRSLKPPPEEPPVTEFESGE